MGETRKNKYDVLIRFGGLGPRDLEIQVPHAILRRLVSWMFQKDGKEPTSDIFEYPVLDSPIFGPPIR